MVFFVAKADRIAGEPVRNRTALTFFRAAIASRIERQFHYPVTIRFNAVSPCLLLLNATGFGSFMLVGVKSKLHTNSQSARCQWAAGYSTRLSNVVGVNPGQIVVSLNGESRGDTSRVLKPTENK